MIRLFEFTANALMGTYIFLSFLWATQLIIRSKRFRRKLTKKTSLGIIWKLIVVLSYVLLVLSMGMMVWYFWAFQGYAVIFSVVLLGVVIFTVLSKKK